MGKGWYETMWLDARGFYREMANLKGQDERKPQRGEGR